MDPLALDLGPERDRRSVVELLADGVLDASLAGIAWMLLETGVPIVTAAGPSGTGKTVLLRALLAFAPPTLEARTIAGAWETWSWLPADERRAVGVGAVGMGSADAADVGGRGTGDRTLLVVPEISDHLPIYSSGRTARAAIRLASRGYQLAATVHAESLREVLGFLGGPTVGAAPDELTALGLVLVIRAVDGGRPGSRRRVVAAHYVRPLARDVHGHVQRLDPAVLATWDAADDAFEDFSWGVVAELAERTGRSSSSFETEHRRRAEYLDALVAAGVRDEPEVVAAVRSFGRPAARA